MSASSQKAIDTLADTILQVVESRFNSMSKDLIARIERLEGTGAMNEIFIGVGQPNADAKIWIDTTDLYPPTEDETEEEGEETPENPEDEPAL